MHNPPLFCVTKTSPAVWSPVQGPVLRRDGDRLYPAESGQDRKESGDHGQQNLELECMYLLSLGL